MRLHSNRGGFTVAALVALLVGGGLVVGGLGLYGYANSTRNEAVTREIQLSAQYLSNQNYLSSYISTFYEQVGIANLKSQKMDEILIDAAKGRYGENGIEGGSLMVAIAEAYPDLKSLDIYDKIMTTVSSGREGYRAIQDKLLDQLRAYDTWRAQGILRSWALGSFFPSSNLKARIGDTELVGGEALKKMYQIVLASQAKDAYEKGTMDPLTVPGSEVPKGSKK
jgi:hypothetical protein